MKMPEHKSDGRVRSSLLLHNTDNSCHPWLSYPLKPEGLCFHSLENVPVTSISLKMEANFNWKNSKLIEPRVL